MHPRTHTGGRCRGRTQEAVRALLGRALAVTAASLFALASPADGQERPDGQTDEILSVVHGLLDAIAERDSAAARDLLAPDARILRIVVEADSARRQWRDADAFLRGIGGEGPRLKETIHDPQVATDGPHATVRTRYDFRVDGAFSHCGTNVFHLTRGPDGWVLAAVAYTVRTEPSACPRAAPGAARPDPSAGGRESGTGAAHRTRPGAPR